LRLRTPVLNSFDPEIFSSQLMRLL
jgi:hypothetical protein